MTDHQHLDEKIQELSHRMPDAPHWTGIGLERGAWPDFWSLAREIQQMFNSGVRYPSKDQRQAAWQRFNALRDEAVKRGRQEKEALKDRSKAHKQEILSICSGITYSFFQDSIFVFDRTTVEQMKRWQEYLREGMEKLRDHKHEMLGEDKQECFEHMQAIKESHDQFWRDYKIHQQEKRERRQYKARNNLEANYERLRKAANALEHQRDRADELRSQIASTTSTKWEAIWSEWLAEAEEMIDDIEQQIQRIQSWIEEDEQRLGNLS